MTPLSAAAREVLARKPDVRLLVDRTISQPPRMTLEARAAGGGVLLMTSDVDGWLAALETIRALDFEYLVPGHGPLTDRSSLDDQRAILLEWKSRVAAAVAEGLSREETQERVNLKERFPVDIGQEYMMDYIMGHNAGSFAETDFAQIDQTFAVNTLGPMRVTQALLPNLRSGERKLIMNMSSGLGSIANNERGGMVDYRASKAALNMVSRTLGAELSDEGFIVVSMSPGWVRTDMGGANADLSVEEGALGIVWAATLGDEGPSGGFFRHGKPIDW